MDMHNLSVYCTPSIFTTNNSKQANNRRGFSPITNACLKLTLFKGHMDVKYLKVKVDFLSTWGQLKN